MDFRGGRIWHMGWFASPVSISCQAVMDEKRKKEEYFACFVVLSVFSMVVHNPLVVEG